MQNEDLLKELFTLFVENKKILQVLNDTPMPNIPMPTMGGIYFWDDLKECNGWRLQRNSVFGNCRILDPDNVRRAWGSMDSMIKLFEKFDHLK